MTLNDTQQNEASSFQSLNLRLPINKALADLKYSQLSSAQTAALPYILQGKDTAVKAKTGSGKTLAFSISLLQGLLEQSDNMVQKSTSTKSGIYGLVLCPTRELAQQVAEQIRLLAKHIPNTKISSFVGGVAIGPQIASLVHTPDIVVGTPGRIMDLIRKGKLNVENVQKLVLDEADRILDMGFSDQMEWILKALPKQRHSMLFSATYGGAIERLTKQYLRQAAIVEVEQTQQHSQISQLAYVLQDNLLEQGVSAVLTHHQPKSCMIFCQTKIQTQSLCNELQHLGFSALTIHGDLTQFERQRVLTQFALQCCNVLVATDVAARGLDLEQVELVINAQIADSSETHTHRIGRTGRAEHTGTAITLIEESQKAALERITHETESKIPIKHIQALRFHVNRIVLPGHECVMVDGGKKQKISKGDLLGALIKQAEVPKEDIGKMQVTHDKCYIAIKQRSVKKTLQHFREHRVKGKSLRARKLK